MEIILEKINFYKNFAKKYITELLKYKTDAKGIILIISIFVSLYIVLLSLIKLLKMITYEKSYESEIITCKKYRKISSCSPSKSSSSDSSSSSESSSKSLKRDEKICKKRINNVLKKISLV